MRLFALVCACCVLAVMSMTSLVSAATTTCDPGTYTVGFSSAKVRATASTSGQQLAVVRLNNSVPVTGGTQGTSVSGSTLWCSVSMAGDQVGYIHSSLLVAALDAPAVDPLPVAASGVQVIVVPVDNGGTVSTPTPPPAAVSTPIPAVQTSFVCPRNCAAAVAMGLSAQQAGTCPNLDRDHDGVACYGD